LKKLKQNNQAFVGPLKRISSTTIIHQPIWKLQPPWRVEKNTRKNGPQPFADVDGWSQAEDLDDRYNTRSLVSSSTTAQTRA